MEPLAGSTSLALVRHPRSRSQATGRIEVAVGTRPGGILSVTFVLDADFSCLKIPESRASRRGEHLWQHTCFEVFAGGGEGTGYREFNFSPSGEWAAYRFRGYRDGGELELDTAPRIAIQRNRECLTLDADIAPACLPQGCTLQLGLSAVLEDVDGLLSYWALRHPPGKPDFHHIDAFALQLELPECMN
jgi:hypothetical protein